MTFKSEQEATWGELKDQVVKFTEARNWRPSHSGKNLAMSIAIEAAELMEHFQWGDNGDYTKDQLSEEKIREIGLEVADVLIYTLSFCHTLGIDPAQAVQAKLEINEKRFPVPVSDEADRKPV